MNVLNNIWSDLIEKRLWPVAVALLAAIVAVPVMLGGGSSAKDAATPPAPAAPTASAAQAAAPQVVLDPTVAEGQNRRSGAVRDPFKPQHVPKTSTTSTTTTPATTTPTSTTPASGGTSTTPSTGTTTTTTPSDTGGATPSVPKVNPLALYRVSIRFGETGHLKTRRNIARLTPLPSSQYPFFVYLGVLEDKKTAVFMISSDVKVTGDGNCRPSKTSCQTIEVRKGDTVFFDYSPTGDDADVRQFQLDVLSVHEESAPDRVYATKARYAVNKNGSAAVKAARTAGLIPQVNGYVYIEKTGLLHHARRKKLRKAAAARVPDSRKLKTAWGTVYKVNGAVVFVAKKS